MAIVAIVATVAFVCFVSSDGIQRRGVKGVAVLQSVAAVPSMEEYHGCTLVDLDVDIHKNGPKATTPSRREGGGGWGPGAGR